MSSHRRPVPARIEAKLNRASGNAAGPHRSTRILARSTARRAAIAEQLA